MISHAASLGERNGGFRILEEQESVNHMAQSSRPKHFESDKSNLSLLHVRLAHIPRDLSSGTLVSLIELQIVLAWKTDLSRFTVFISASCTLTPSHILTIHIPADHTGAGYEQSRQLAGPCCKTCIEVRGVTGYRNPRTEQLAGCPTH